MAQTLSAILPPGYVRLTGDLSFDVTKTGKKGLWDINQNDPFAVWELTVSYIREEFEDTPALRFDDIYSFFLVSGGAMAFLVDDPMDNTATARNGEGHVELFDGQYRLFKHYKFGPLVYVHPITRPKSGVILSGGAAGGTLNQNTGIVTGISAPGRWDGGFYRPMIFAQSKLRYETDPAGLVRAFDVPLEENLEI